MGESELKAALLKKAEEQVRAVKRQAEGEVELRRREIEDALRDLRENSDRRQNRKTDEIREELLTAARQRIHVEWLRSTRQLEERLKRLVAEELPAYVERGGKKLLKALADELPSMTWDEVCVVPKQRDWAQELFSDASVRTDPELVGGLLVTVGGGRVCVDNSLCGRLQRAWPSLWPTLLCEVEAMVVDDATSDDIQEK